MGHQMQEEEKNFCSKETFNFVETILKMLSLKSGTESLKSYAYFHACYAYFHSAPPNMVIFPCF